MLTLEQYASIYLPMMTAGGNAEQEKTLCSDKGFTADQWNEAKQFYTNKMMDPNDAGKTAMDFSAAMMKGATAPTQQAKYEAPKPADFDADTVNIYVSEYDVQMIEFINKRANDQHIIIQMGFEFDEAQIGFGGDRPHISINNQAYSIYGGVSMVALSSNSVMFAFDDEGRDRMKCDTVTATFNINGKLYNYLKRKMKFAYGDLLMIKDEQTPKEYNVNGTTVNDNWKGCEMPNLNVKIRPNLQNLKDSGKYPEVVFIDFESTTIGKNQDELAVIKTAEENLIDCMEYDLAAVVALHTTSDKMRRYYVYSSLNQGDFMARVNDSFRLLPQMPLNFSGGDDKPWVNYTECLKDVEKNG